MDTLEPSTAEETASVLGDAVRAKTRVAIHGGGTKLDWLAAPACDAVLSTARLNRVIAHRHGDLTATVEAGATLSSVNQALAAHGQWIPLDPPWSDRATIGGIVAAADSGPRRHRYGSPRDLIIGVEIARPDGVRAKAGGIVVKNVAGYDLARLVTGSFGSLGVILNATFKLYPLPAASATVVVAASSSAVAAAVVAALNASQLTPSAVEIEGVPLRVLVRFESTPASVAEQSRQAVRLASECGAHAEVVDGSGEQEAWSAHERRIWGTSGPVVKITLLPTGLGKALDVVEREAGEAAIAGRAALGVLFVRPADDTRVAPLVRALRARVEPGKGSAVVLRASAALAREVDAWGPMGDALPVMRAVKKAFDPDGVLNPGRGPGGI